MAGMIFRVDPFFKGNDNNDQLIKIVKVMGTDGIIEYLKKYKLGLPTALAKVIKQFPGKYFEEFVNKSNQSVVSEEALDLLRKMLVYDKNTRITPIEALKHPYFFPIRNALN
mmetsp:Transcript_13503/g.13233  ORF Transcript_13503/g.13233 Transcript_13503/m.13233 type:complete len:112 (+) Transcript_13503:665-1000(+)